MASQQLAPILATNDDVPGSGFHSVPGRKASTNTGATPGEVAAKLKVLVVDDEAENLNYVRRCLHRRFEVHAVASPTAALEKLSAHTYDIIITDQRMPELTGSKLLARSLEHSPQAVRIVITGYSDYEATVEAINLGKVTGFIQKPFAPTTLLGMLDSVQSTKSRETPDRRDRFHTIVKCLPDAVAVVETDKVVFANDAFGALFGVNQSEELYNRSLSDLLEVQGDISSDTEYLATTADGVSVAVRTSQLDGEQAKIVRLRALSKSHSKPVLLIADTDARMLRSLRRLLGSEYHVHCAQTLEECVQIGRTAPRVDFVLCDETLADGGPEDVWKALTRVGHEVRPVIMSASCSAGSGEPCPVLWKPFTREELHQALNDSRSLHA